MIMLTFVLLLLFLFMFLFLLRESAFRARYVYSGWFSLRFVAARVPRIASRDGCDLVVIVVVVVVVVVVVREHFVYVGIADVRCEPVIVYRVESADVVWRAGVRVARHLAPIFKRSLAHFCNVNVIPRFSSTKTI